MTWTFYARRLKANPSYYGVKSDTDDDVDQFLLEVVQEALGKLRGNDCIQETGEDEFDVAPSILGIAASTYYLDHRTPKQMRLGIREACRLVTGCLSGEAYGQLPGFESRNLVRSKRVDEVGLAWLLYVLCSTHEFDELPVRHNEELLTQELSEELLWGPDADGVLSANRGDCHHNPEVFEAPHTKAFLLMQAYLERARLPISDFVNDTKSVIDNVPRFLAAMQFIAGHEKEMPGSLELLTQFSRTKQFVETRSLVEDDPLQQLPGINTAAIRRIQESGEDGKDETLWDIRKLKRRDASTLIQRSIKGVRSKTPVDQTLDALYAMPLVTAKNLSAVSESDKTSGKVTGILNLELEIERARRSNGPNDKPASLTVLVGTPRQRMLLADATITIGKTGSWTVSNKVSFDWERANADGGGDGGALLVRLLLDEVRGLDSEQLVRLK